MSPSLSKRFCDVLGELDCSLEVENVEDSLVWVFKVHRSCVLELFSKRYSIDLVHSPLCERKVIVGMEWLTPSGVMTDCGDQLVHV